MMGMDCSKFCNKLHTQKEQYYLWAVIASLSITSQISTISLSLMQSQTTFILSLLHFIKSLTSGRKTAKICEIFISTDILWL